MEKQIEINNRKYLILSADKKAVDRKISELEKLPPQPERIPEPTIEELKQRVSELENELNLIKK